MIRLCTITCTLLLLASCVSVKAPKRPNVQLGHTMLLIPPLSTDSSLDLNTFGQYCRTEAVAIAGGSVRYAKETEKLQNVVTPKNLLPDGYLNRPEILDISQSIDCPSVGVVQVLEKQSLPPQRIVLRVMWLRSKDGGTYVDDTIDLNMKDPVTQELFGLFVRQKGDIEATFDEWTGKAERYAVDTARLSPENFLRFAAAVGIRRLINPNNNLRRLELLRGEALAQKEAGELAQELLALENKIKAEARQREVERARKSIQELEAKRKKLELDYLEAKKKLEIAALEKKLETVVNTKPTDRDLRRMDMVKDRTEMREGRAIRKLDDDAADKIEDVEDKIASQATTLYKAAVRKRLAGDLTGATEDLKEVTNASPNFPWGFYQLGIVYYERNMYKEAMSAYQRVIESGNAQLRPHAELRFYLAEKHQNGESTRLAGFAKSWKSDKWPAPVIEMLLDEITVEECLKKAQHHRDSIENGQLCSAHFYIGEMLLLDGRVDQALEHFVKAAEYETDWAERDAAMVRLGMEIQP